MIRGQQFLRHADTRAAGLNGGKRRKWELVIEGADRNHFADDVKGEGGLPNKGAEADSVCDSEWGPWVKNREQKKPGGKT